MSRQTNAERLREIMCRAITNANQDPTKSCAYFREALHQAKDPDLLWELFASVSTGVIHTLFRQTRDQMRGDAPSPAPNTESEAKQNVPQGQLATASLSVHPSEEMAPNPLPQGQGSSATSSDQNTEGDARRQLPQGQASGALPSVLQTGDEAIISAPQGHRVSASPSVYKEPTESQRTAVRAAKTISAAVMSGVYIPDHSGGREPFDLLRIRYYDMTERRLARAVGRNSVAYNLLRLAKMRRPANYEQMPATTASIDIFSTTEIKQMQREAAVFAGHGLISLPEELRSSVAEAVAADVE